MNACLICQRRGHDRRAQHDHHTCRPCAARLAAALREIADRWPMLTPERPTGTRAPVSDPGYGSRSPANDTAISLADPRTNWDGIPGVHAALTSWVRAIYEDRYLPESRQLDAWQWQPDNEVPAMVDWLVRELDWITAQPWVDDFAAELTDVHAAIRVQTGEPPAEPDAWCIAIIDDERTECGAPLFLPEPVPDLVAYSDVKTHRVHYEQVPISIRCTRCHRPYSWLEVLRARVDNIRTAQRITGQESEAS